MADDVDINDGQFLERLREASLESAAQQLRVIHELKQWRPATLAELVSEKCAAQPAVDLQALRTGATNFLYDLTRLSTRLWLLSHEQWLALSRRHFDYLALQLGAGGLKRAPRESRASRLALRAKARNEKSASVRLIIENPGQTAGRVEIARMDLRDEHDGTGQQAQVAARPDRAPRNDPELGARRSGLFELIFTPDDAFHPGRRYVGETRVLLRTNRTEEVLGELSIEVDGPEPTAPPPRPRAPVRRRSSARKAAPKRTRKT
jgi:hypothetical protein